MRPDAAAASDGNRTDAIQSDGLHLLLSEVKNTISGTEFIEIYNPSGRVIALEDYYLADNGAYASLPTASGPGPKPQVDKSDFIARFPPGTTISPGQALTIAVDPTIFNFTFGVDPNFRIGNSGPGLEMLNAYPSSIGSQSSLTDIGEGIVLFYWDGASDLVSDVDMFIAGANATLTVANSLEPKTGLSIDGPDADNLESSYQTDLASMQGFARGTLLLESFARVASEDGAELQEASGNGFYGHDESSENTAATWAIISVATPGVVEPTL